MYAHNEINCKHENTSAEIEIYKFITEDIKKKCLANILNSCRKIEHYLHGIPQ